MPNRCCVQGCSSGSTTEGDANNARVFRFPTEKGNPEERIRWIDALKEIDSRFQVKKFSVVCEKHWPTGYKSFPSKGRLRPCDPPSVFIVSKTSKSLTPKLKPDQDDLPDSFTYQTLKKIINWKKHGGSIVLFEQNNSLYIQSTNFFNGVPSYLLIIHDSLQFETFHCGIKIYLPTMTRRRTSMIDKWSILDETLHCLSSFQQDNKVTALKEQISAMSCVPVGQRIFTTDIIMKAFEYLSISRSLYSRLREDYKLPSVKTLTRLTTKVSKIEDENFLKRIFDSIDLHQKNCFLLFDEVYVKKMLTYHGGSIFGKAENNPSMLATAVLGIMVITMLGGPSFLSRAIPVAKLNAEFLFEQLQGLISKILLANGNVIALICDGNRTNQVLFKRFEVITEKPWLTIDNKFLLFDYVHIVKNIRNNWMTEKTGELNFEDGGVLRTAKWEHLSKLYYAESKSPLVKLSKLNEKSHAKAHRETVGSIISLCVL